MNGSKAASLGSNIPDESCYGDRRSLKVFMLTPRKAPPVLTPPQPTTYHSAEASETWLKAPRSRATRASALHAIGRASNRSFGQKEYQCGVIAMDGEVPSERQ